jgi:hypothetical protein
MGDGAREGTPVAVAEYGPPRGGAGRWFSRVLEMHLSVRLDDLLEGYWRQVGVAGTA